MSEDQMARSETTDRKPWRMDLRISQDGTAEVFFPRRPSMRQIVQRDIPSAINKLRRAEREARRLNIYEMANHG